MIVAGYSKLHEAPTVWYRPNTSEIVDMDDPSRICNSPVTYPNPVWNAIGGTVNSIPMVCGGSSATNYHETSCYKFDTDNFAWTFSHDLITGRNSAASSNFIDQLWVTGGITGTGRTKSTEFVTLTGTLPGPDLPSPR